jgi:hypothetical protein
MNALKLHPMKEVKIILEGEHLHFVTDVLDQKRIPRRAYDV